MKRGQVFSKPLLSEKETVCVHSWEKNYSTDPNGIFGFLQTAKCLDSKVSNILTGRVLHVCSVKHMHRLLCLCLISVLHVVYVGQYLTPYLISEPVKRIENVVL